MHFRKPRFGEIAEFSEEEITTRFDVPKSLRHCTYSTNIDGWEKYYPDSQMLVGFFDDLERDPRYLLSTIFEFLEIDAGDDVIPANVVERRNPGRSEVIPPAVERFLARRLIDEVRSLHARIDNENTQGWLDYTEALL
jgi:ADP-ribose pyrophosphatase YjhB (NUDIX family)